MVEMQGQGVALAVGVLHQTPLIHYAIGLERPVAAAAVQG